MQQRLTAAVDDLQQVIQDTRAAIFELPGGSSGITRLRQRLDEAIAGLAGSELHTTVQFSGPAIGWSTPPWPVTQRPSSKPLGNAVRHAEANPADRACQG